MKITSLLVLLVASLFSTSLANAGQPNVLLICVDDLRPELHCFGIEYIHSPNIDKLAETGIRFSRHYVQAPTCGASRYSLLTGRYGPASNGALFQRANRIKADPDSVPPSLPAWFRQHGYTAVSVGKVSHHPGGRGGPDWNAEDQPELPLSWDRHLLPAGDWQHPRGWMHGLAHGEIRMNAGNMDVLQATDGPDNIYPDGIAIDEALRQLANLAADDKPFFLAVGILRPHLPFGAPKKYHDLYAEVELPTTPHPAKPSAKTTWHGSGEFMKYNRWQRNPNTDGEFALEVRRAYAACVSYADSQVGRLLKALDETGQRSNTIIVLWGDHGWHLGEHAIWGKHALFEESLRSPLIINAPARSKSGRISRAVVETRDLFPTLCELASLDTHESIHGTSLVPLLEKPRQAGHPAVSYNGRARTIRTETHRLIVHNDGYTELYDHRTLEAETKNIAMQNPDLVETLSGLLSKRLAEDRAP